MWMQSEPLKMIGALNTLEFKVLDSKTTIVFFHGYGADAYDLAPLREEMGLTKLASWYFPQGPKEVPIGPGFWGRAWFPIDMVAHERAIQAGVELSYAERRPPGVNEARDQAQSFLKALGVPTENLILGGFSQGSMLAVELVLNMATAPKALVILSGTLADQNSLREKAPRMKGLKVFQSHGEQDQILPFSQAKALHTELQAAGWDDIWCPFSGGHEIPGSVLRDLKSFLRSVI